eukprot:Opistho-2@60173
MEAELADEEGSSDSDYITANSSDDSSVGDDVAQRAHHAVHTDNIGDEEEQGGDTDGDGDWASDESDLDFILHDPPPATERDDNEMHFDPRIASTHSYLGRLRDVSNRFQEPLFPGSRARLVLLAGGRFNAGLVLYPGHTIPLRLECARFHRIVSEAIESSTAGFGFLSCAMVGEDMRAVGKVGTTAIVQYVKMDDGTNSIDVVIRGEQRFRVLSVRHVGDYDVADVEVLPGDLPFLPPTVDAHSKRWLSPGYSGKRLPLCATAVPWFAFRQCDSRRLMATAMRLRPFVLASTPDDLSGDPERYSWWLASNITATPKLAQQLLNAATTAERLRLEIDHLAQFDRLCCTACTKTVAMQSCVFSMSSGGPMGAYVNPGGVVHETLTVTDVPRDAVRLVGRPSTESSWFPGYAWTVAVCGRCFAHLGWRFTAVERLSPRSFYGLTRTAVVPRPWSASED